jgi:hypothetical protein
MTPQTLAEVLGRLPLVLDHAAAYCKRKTMRQPVPRVTHGTGHILIAGTLRTLSENWDARC